MSKKLERRLEELEREVRELKARPQVICPIIFPQPPQPSAPHYSEPYYIPPQVPYMAPTTVPSPVPTWWPQVTC